MKASILAPCHPPRQKNVFDALQDLSDSIGGLPGPQLEAADRLSELITHDLHQSLIELLESPQILSLHAVLRVETRAAASLEDWNLMWRSGKGLQRVG